MRTLGNAIARDRLAHAFLMTGVRGVGKTSTARLIAKGPELHRTRRAGRTNDRSVRRVRTVPRDNRGAPYRRDRDGRLASNTGVDDVREIIEAVRYAAVSARYKIYIIDEVHMLSRNAFNALLKTLEEPPPHVKFLFCDDRGQQGAGGRSCRAASASTFAVSPPTCCSRISVRSLQKEGVEAEAPAIWLIANAAEGSVRDGLSILDQGDCPRRSGSRWRGRRTDFGRPGPHDAGPVRTARRLRS